MEFVRQATERVQNRRRSASGADFSAPLATTRVIRVTLDEAVKACARSQPGHRRPAAEPRDQRHFVREPEVDLSAVKLTSQLSTQDQVNASATTIAGAAAGAPIDTGLTTANAGITQNVLWGGGNYSITLNNNKATTVAANQLINPAYNTNWAASTRNCCCAASRPTRTARRFWSPRSTATSPMCSSNRRSPTRCQTSGRSTGITCSPCSRCRWPRPPSTSRYSS